MKRKLHHDFDSLIAAKRQKTFCEISDLPNEMLREIFKFLPASDRLDARMVSNFWMQLANEYFPKDNTISLNASMNFSPKGQLFKIFESRLTNKVKRNFPYLVIDHFPEDKKLDEMLNFLKLIGDEIQFLKVFACQAIENINQKLYEMFPNLESLEVTNENLLGNFSFSSKLKTIKVNSEFSKFHEIPVVQSVKNFTTKSQIITFNTESLVPLVEPQMKMLLDSMFTHHTDRLELKSGHNFCGEAKMSVKDITKADLCQKEFNLAPLTEFNSLKKLTIQTCNKNALVQFTSSNQHIQFQSITHLIISGWNKCDHKLKNVDKLFKNFPNLENLDLSSGNLVFEDEDFRSICKNMPKLKVLMYYRMASEISLSTIFDADNFSFKDLESLWIETKSESFVYPCYFEYPSLPKLKNLHLRGTGIRYLGEHFYSQVARKSPELCDIEIEPLNLEENPSKFYPLLDLPKLKRLTLPGYSAFLEQAHNTELIENVIQRCKDLEVFYLNDGNGFSLAQELYLMKKLPKLETLGSAEIDGGVFREFCRNSQTKYLMKSLGLEITLYKDVNGTLDYLYYYFIPHSYRIHMEKAFSFKIGPNFGFRDLQTLIIVLHNYLN